MHTSVCLTPRTLVLATLFVCPFGLGCSDDLPTFTFDGGPIDGSTQRDATARDGAPSADATTTGCANNKACRSTDYCYFDRGCGTEGVGVCQARPFACNDLYAPVCGCDSKTYGNACDAASAGQSVKHDGECRACAELEQTYVQLVNEAKRCSPTGSEPCKHEIQRSLACGCPTLVGTLSGKAKMDELRVAWNRLACPASACSCAPPQGAKCVAKDNSYRCEDVR